MKNLKLSFLKSRPAFLTVFIALLSFFVVSCEQENLDVPEETAQLTIYDLLSTDTDSDKRANPNAKGAPAPGDASIAEIAIANEDFNQLVAALLYVDEELDAGLVDLFLNGNDQYTVFAPTDAAFQELYTALGGDVDEITDLPAELVLAVLQYHVVEGRRASNSVVPRKNTRTIETLLEDATFSVNTTPEIIAVGSTADFVLIDISASNGIIHVIDSVLLPIVVE